MRVLSAVQYNRSAQTLWNCCYRLQWQRYRSDTEIGLWCKGFVLRPGLFRFRWDWYRCAAGCSFRYRCRQFCDIICNRIPMVAECLFHIQIHQSVCVLMVMADHFFMSDVCWKWIFSRKDIPESEDGTVDSDVMNEKNRIRSITAYSDSNLIVKDFTKFYGNTLAVNQICVGVERYERNFYGQTMAWSELWYPFFPRSECFGLLGVNGAGKTSMFKMLTGDETITSGEAWVEGISIKSDMNKVHQRIGYCPQFDALFDDLTGRETLKIFALLRGIPSDEIDEVSTRLAIDLAFTKHLDKRISAYSGGNKRKLSTALVRL